MTQVDALSFFSGRVEQTIADEPSIRLHPQLSELIDRANGRIKSVTGEVEWDYRKGALTVNTPYCQGCIGFISRIGGVSLPNITINTTNEHITVFMVALDERPLQQSTMVLLQVMTKDRMFGWHDDGTKIQCSGHTARNVENIHVSVKVNLPATGFYTTLDQNMYNNSPSLPRDDSEIVLRNDQLYTVFSSLPLPDYKNGAVPHAEKTGLADDGWWAFEPDNDNFAPCAVDLRQLNERIAGEDGSVRVDDGGFVLANGSPVRFWAVNCGPSVIDSPSADIDYLAARLAKAGVNMVRMHGSAFYSSTSQDINTVNEAYLDRFHYFVYAMKQQGIYTKLSFYFPLWIRMKAEYGYAGYCGEYEGKYPFGLLQYDERFQEMYNNWARRILLSVNPYTGVPLAKESAIAMVEIQNEDSYLFATFNRNHIPAEQFYIIGRKFFPWLVEKYGSVAKLTTAYTGCMLPDDDFATEYAVVQDIDACALGAMTIGSHRQRLSDQVQFLVEYQMRFYTMMRNFYKQELGVSALISASNWMTIKPEFFETLERYSYSVTDVIDRHGYFEQGHHAHHIEAGQELHHMSALVNADLAITQMNFFKGLPHIISETTWPMPNKYKGEAVPLWSIYGALQGIDGIFMFAVSSTNWEVSPRLKWPLLIPSMYGQFPLFSLIYRKGYIKTAPPVVSVTNTLAQLYDFQGSPIYESAAIDELRRVK